MNLPTCLSTNDIALSLAREGKAKEGLVVITPNQTAGRGQMGNKWMAEAGKNLTFSLVLQPEAFILRNQFQLNMLVAVAVTEALNSILGGGIMLKWPNDIYFVPKGMNKAWKLGGMLIENIISGKNWTYSIVGIGLNVNQEELPIETAISLRNITGKEYEIDDVLEKVIQSIEEYYLSYTPVRASLLQKSYYKNLYRYHEPAKYQSGEDVFEGTITGVDDAGRLVIETKTTTRKFEIKEVSFVGI